MKERYEERKKSAAKKRGAYIANENNTKQIKCPDGQFALCFAVFSLFLWQH